MSLQLEIVPKEVNAASTELSVPAEKALSLFAPFKAPYAAAAELLLKESAATEAPAARRLRLDMVKARTSIASAKKSAKADILLAGNVIDYFHNKGVEQLVEAEARLEAIEKAEENRVIAEKAALKTKRTAELSELGVDGQFYPLAEMPEDAYQQLVNAQRVARDARVAAEAKAAAEDAEAARLAEVARLAKIEEERVERERINAENARLKAEADERERLAKIEREEAAAKLAAAEESARVERERLAAEAAKAKKAADEAARVERERVAAQLAEAEKSRLAQLAEIERVAKIERERVAKEKAEAEKLAAAKLAEAELKAKAEREAAAEVARVEREKREALERAESERVAAEKRRQEKEALEARKAAAAPDKTKINAFADLLETLELPELSTVSGKKTGAVIAQNLKEFTASVRASANNL